MLFLLYYSPIYPESPEGEKKKKIQLGKQKAESMDPQGLTVQPQPPPTALTTPSTPTTPVAVASNIAASVAEFDELAASPSSLTPSEMDDSGSEREGPDFTISSSFHAPKPSQTPKDPAEKTPVRKARTLIDLPLDVLKDIVKEVCFLPVLISCPNVLITTLLTNPRHSTKVNNTNDLVSLSLTCHCLHNLAIPHIYSRFDIVWPDSNTVGDRSGVDALTYGLATLVASGPRGNNYGRWIKKFSLGNGPADWVGEYNISKEGGKMLGTLVNLAIMRMENLETFNWDMPTGVLRDIFMSLHDLCPQSLKNVHVRFHDNSDTAAPMTQDPSRRVETPTFKGFKSLRQLSVLDIDERQYLEEMAWAIENSVDTLRELRMGLADHISKGGKWIWDLDDGPGDVVEVVLGGGSGLAVGGVMGILVNRICELTARQKRLRGDVAPSSVPGLLASATVTTSVAAPAVTLEPAQQSTAAAGGETQPEVVNQPDPVPVSNEDTFSVAAMAAALPPSNGTAGAEDDTPVPAPPPTVEPVALASTPQTTTVAHEDQSPKAYIYEEEKPYKQLKLETLELERVPISVRVLQKVIDWSVLTQLTILNCPNHEKLWKMLRRKFSPFPSSVGSPSLSVLNQGQFKNGLNSMYNLSSRSGGRRIAQGTTAAQTPEYKIRLKKLHTDLVSPSLIAFIRETLAPNSLEVLFLQENPQQSNTPTGYSSAVTIDMIFKSCIKRHRVSLRKLLVDSNVGSAAAYESDKWRFHRDVITFITTAGKMPRLRELGFAIDYKDWHFFLTRLPGLAGLRSLYLPHVKGAVQMPLLVCKEMALQVVDVVSLRNEVEICYVGIMNKCFELLEGKYLEDDILGDAIGIEDMEEDEEGSDDDVDDVVGPQGDAEDEEEVGIDEDEEDEEEANGGTATQALGVTGVGGKDEESGDETAGNGVPPSVPRGVKDNDKLRVHLREILFYDDKVAVFKARSGKL